MRMIKNLLLCGGLCLSLSLSAQINTPVTMFEPQIISTGHSFGLTLSPSGDTAYFVNSFGGRQQLVLMQSEKKNGRWSVPKPAFFGKKGVREIDPFISPDGAAILYNSRKSTTEQKEKDLDVWMLKKQHGKWSEPFPIDAINSPEQETYATTALSGNIYFGVNKEGGYGAGDIYLSKLKNGKYQKPTNLGFPINTDKDEGNCFIAADESYMIFSANGYNANFGGFDLYISFNQCGNWSVPINLGDKINTTDNDFCPIVAKGNTLYFSRSKADGDRLVENIYYTTLNIPLLKAMSNLQPTAVLEKAFPDGDAYGITFSPDGKTAYTTRSNETRTVCEVYSLRISDDGSFSKPKKMDAWNMTNNVANPVISHDGSFALLRISSALKDPDLYISRKDDTGNWQTPTPLPIYINTEIDQYYPEITSANDIYYSSNGDVFYAEYQNGKWQQPKPVKELNTTFSESNIAISRDGNILVFLSDRTGVYGSYDLFVSKKVNGIWSEPINLGTKVNSNIMEYQPRFSIDNSELYFTRSVFKDGRRQGKDLVLKVKIANLINLL
jgi:hypothetical protein